MGEPMSQAQSSHSPATVSSRVEEILPPGETEVSCRVPLIWLFTSAAVWLLISSAFALISSIKFHSPTFLADVSWLTYGRVRPAYSNSMLYGFCVQAGLGAGLWLLAHLGRVVLSQGWLVIVGAVLWNLGVTVGIGGILAGDSPGFETLELPGYAAVLLFLGYLMIGLSGALTFHARRERRLFVSQWFILAGLFWFPWIYSTAQLLLVTFPVRGVTQSVIAWWYANNLQFVWLWLMGLAVVFYMVPKLTGRELHSRNLALFSFWMIILFNSWGGIPSSAPVPSWIPVLSTVMTTMMVLPLVMVGLSVYRTVGGESSKLFTRPALRFTALGVIALLAAGPMHVLGALPEVGRILDLTWFGVAEAQLNSYGFFAMVMFGVVYYILPRLTGMAFPSPKLVRAHFWLAALGILLIGVPLAVGGLVEGYRLQNAAIPFLDVVKTTLHFLRASTVGDLLLAVGHVFFLLNVLGLTIRFYRARAVSAYSVATEDLYNPAEVRA